MDYARSSRARAESSERRRRGRAQRRARGAGRDLRRSAQRDGEPPDGDDASSDYDFEVTSVATTSGTLTVNAEGSVPAGLTSVAGYETLWQRVTSEATWGTGKLEVALVLDSTGSMSQLQPDGRAEESR